MKRKLALILVAVLLLLPFSYALARSAEEEEMVRYTEKIVNEFREKEGLPSYKVSPRMEAFAQEWAEEMQRRDRLEHRSHEDFRAFMGKNSMTIGENIAYYFSSKDGMSAMEEILQGWIDSPGHYDNMTQAGDTHFGIGISKVGNKTYAVFNMGGYFSGVEKENGDSGLNDVVGLEAEDARGKVWKVSAPKSAPDALNGTVKMELRPSGKGYKIALLNKEGKEVSSRGYVDVYFPLAKGQKISNVTIGGVTWTERMYTEDRKYFIMRIEIIQK